MAAASSALRPARKLESSGGSAAASSKTSCSMKVRRIATTGSARTSLSTIERRNEIGAPQMTKGNQQRGADGQGEQHTGEAEQLSERQQGEDHRERMQADAMSYEPRHEQIVLEQLTDRLHGQHGCEAGPAAPLQQRCEHAQCQAQTKAYV